MAFQAGVPPTSTVTDTSSYTFTTPVLMNGDVYTLSFSSRSSEQITPGTVVPAPVMGHGLIVLLAVGCVLLCGNLLERSKAR